MNKKHPVLASIIGAVIGLVLVGGVLAAIELSVERHTAQSQARPNTRVDPGDEEFREALRGFVMSYANGQEDADELIERIVQAHHVYTPICVDVD